MSPPAGSRSPRRGIFVILGGMMLMSCAGCAGLILLFRPIVEPVTDGDRAVLLTIEDLAPYLTTTVDPTRATLTRFRQPGRVEIEYEFEQPGVFVSTEIISSFTTKQEMRGFTPGLLNLAATSDVRFSELHGVLAWGDESRVLLLTKTTTNAKVGNLILVRKGTRRATFTFVGVFVDDADSANKLLGAKLAALESWTAQ